MEDTIELESQVRELLRSDNKTELYIRCDKKSKLHTAYTFNPKHNTVFMLYRQNEKKDEDINYQFFLEELLDYVNNVIPSSNMLHYSVTWNMLNGDDEKHTSHFTVRDFDELSRKMLKKVVTK